MLSRAPRRAYNLDCARPFVQLVYCNLLLLLLLTRTINGRASILGDSMITGCSLSGGPSCQIRLHLAQVHPSQHAWRSCRRQTRAAIMTHAVGLISFKHDLIGNLTLTTHSDPLHTLAVPLSPSHPPTHTHTHTHTLRISLCAIGALVSCTRAHHPKCRALSFLLFPHFKHFEIHSEIDPVIE
jgi:hypothetical protein